MLRISSVNMPRALCVWAMSLQLRPLQITTPASSPGRGRLRENPPGETMQISRCGAFAAGTSASSSNSEEAVLLAGDAFSQQSRCFLDYRSQLCFAQCARAVRQLAFCTSGAVGSSNSEDAAGCEGASRAPQTLVKQPHHRFSLPCSDLGTASVGKTFNGERVSSRQLGCRLERASQVRHRRVRKLRSLQGKPLQLCIARAKSVTAALSNVSHF